MSQNQLKSYRITDWTHPLNWMLVGVIVLCGTVVFTQSLLPLAILPLLFIVWVTVVEIKWIYYLLFFLIPFSTETDLPGGINIDFPAELFMLGLMFVFILWGIRNFAQLDAKALLHPLTLLLLAHYLWIFIGIFHSEHPLISVKFFLSKTWFIIVFFFAILYLYQDRDTYKKSFEFFFIALLTTVIIVTIRHGIEQDFSFSGVNFVLGPFYRNHVTYASICAVFWPFVYWLYRISPERGYLRWIYAGSLVILFIAINLSYTRAAIGAIILSAAFAYIIKKQWTRYAIIASILVGALFIGNLFRNSNYLNLAPRYEKAISHDKFDDLLSATYKLEDISTMERVYRWVAAFHMIGDKPAIGYGPGSFYSSYKGYTLNKFRTYVSDNPEQSGVHNYFLMLAVEQGIIGLVLFLTLVIIFFLYAEKVYHSTVILWEKYLVMAAALSMFIIVILQLMNDLIETDKVGPFFFLSLAIIVWIHQKYVPSRKTQI
jgi:O-antigen ligase